MACALRLGWLLLLSPLVPLVEAWLDWLWQSDELRFDVSSAPALVHSSLFPAPYRAEMAWGTYRPGVYFGVKGRHEGSFLLGLAWGSMDGATLRHECQSGELQAFGWLEHDGQSYGRQHIEDQHLQLQLFTTFAKESAAKWHARVDTRPLPSGSKARPLSLFLYLGLEGKESLRIESQEDWQACGSSWCRSVLLSGEDPVKGAFRARLTFRTKAKAEPAEPQDKDKDKDKEKEKEKEKGDEGRGKGVGVRFHHGSARVQHEKDNLLTGVWDASAHLRRLLKPVNASAKKKRLVLPDEDSPAPNFLAFQLAGYPASELGVDAHVAFDSADLGPSAAESLALDELAERKSSSFKQQLSEVFELRDTQIGNFSTEDQRAAVAAAVSGLLGGMGDFRGRLLARHGEGLERLERLAPATLFTAVPSRSFFPRGFLWDEGFHGLLLSRWHPRIFLDVLAHWLELQQASGWIPREVPLGAEQEKRVPEQFLPQDPNVANPPSLLLPFAWLVNVAIHPTPFAGALAKRAGLSASELRQLVLSFGAAALPRLSAWFAFLDKSQKSSHPSGCYRWVGRTAAHCLASGLDDYPRGLLVNGDECHLDLHAWMTLFARTLATLCDQLQSEQALSDEGLCAKPRWQERAAKLNASLFNVFADPKVPTAPLADVLGAQPVDKRGKAVVVPPWRTDGRCGPQFPVGRGPGECDPYGGAPCCSPSGWCGGSPDFCNCPGCWRSVKLEERTHGLETAKVHSPHLGYVSLFPLVLGLQPCDHPRAARLLKALRPKGELWSPFGVMSLSSKDPLFRQGEDYWRGKIWANLNYLAISAMHHCSEETAESLKEGFVTSVLGTLQRQRYLMENFDPKTGEGRGAAPFSGWTALVALVLADLPLTLSEDEGSGGPGRGHPDL